MAPKEDEQERREVVRRLEHKHKEAEATLLKAEQDAAIARVEVTNLRAARRRAQLAPPDGDICPECWIMHGRVASMVCAQADDPARYDRFRCGDAGCGYTVDRRTGL